MELKQYHVLSLIAALLSLQTSFSRAAVKGGYWFPDSGIDASDIDSTLFTHLFCAFADLNTATNQLSISSECSSFTQTVQQRSTSVKTLLSIGGGNAPSSDFNKMASQPASRKTFITSSINLARSNGFLGLDLDWEQQTTSTEMTNLGTLVTEWRTAINAEAANTGRQPLLLTAALAWSPRVNPSASYPAQAIAKSLDWVNVMAYDFYDPNRSPSLTRSHAALRDPSGGASGSSGISAWISAGVPPKQLVLGFPYYGYAWKLVNPNNHGILAPANGIDTSVGVPDGGIPDYNQIEEFISQKRATVVFNSSYGTNYCYSGTTWINYDDTQTIAAKVSYAKTNNLLGYFAWSLAQDHNWALSRQALQTWGTLNQHLPNIPFHYHNNNNNNNNINDNNAVY